MSKKNQYRITEVKEAKQVATDFLKSVDLDKAVDFGLPEIDDRYHIWRVPILSKTKENIGEIVIDAITTLINDKKSTNKEVLESRLLGRKALNGHRNRSKENGDCPKISNLRNTIGFGDSEQLLTDTPNESIDLVFTSPPYYNARPEYAEYITYEEYLLKMRKIIHQSHLVLMKADFSL